MIRVYKGIAPEIAPTAFIESSAQIIGDVHVGEQSSVWFNCVLRGDVHYIRVGKYTNIQDGTIIHVTNGRFPTILGDCVTVGHAAVLHGRRVGSGTLVGIGATLLGGSEIGEECVIAAGAVVPPGMRVPPRSVVMGVPGRVVRPATADEVALTRTINARYRELARRYAAGEFPRLG